MKAFKLFLVFVLSFLFAAVALAQPILPDVDPFAQLVLLLSQAKTAGPLVLGMGIVVLLGQLVKSYVGDAAKYKRLIVTVLSCAYGVLFTVVSGHGIADAIVVTMITGGGAVAIYEALKGVGIIKGSSDPAPQPAAPSA